MLSCIVACCYCYCTLCTCCYFHMSPCVRQRLLHIISIYWHMPLPLSPPLMSLMYVVVMIARHYQYMSCIVITCYYYVSLCVIIIVSPPFSPSPLHATMRYRHHQRHGYVWSFGIAIVVFIVYYYHILLHHRHCCHCCVSLRIIMYYCHCCHCGGCYYYILPLLLYIIMCCYHCRHPLLHGSVMMYCCYTLFSLYVILYHYIP